MTQRRPRTTRVRIGITALVSGAIVALWWSSLHLVLRPTFGHSVITDWLALLIPVVPTAVLCRLGGYRWFDALGWIFPPWGMVLTARMAWRASLLPYRNWPARPGDEANWIPATNEDAPPGAWFIRKKQRRASSN